MVLSHMDLEEIAAAVMRDFWEFCYPMPPLRRRGSLATPIERFAVEYLGLEVSYARLSADGSICGLTAYVDTKYEVVERGQLQCIPLKRNQVLLDSRFIQQGQIRRQNGRRRFTLAHECAHQILFQLEVEEQKAACRQSYSARKSYSLQELKTREDWNEWQANVLGSAILMPQREVVQAVRELNRGRPLKNYEGWSTHSDGLILTKLCRLFEVSRSALLIRLKWLGCVEDLPYAAYNDPMEVWA